jgi:hypothetical protein
MIIQKIKPCCSICNYWNISNNKENDGWCSHLKLNGRHFSIDCAINGIQPDCPFIENVPFSTRKVWKPQLDL